MREALVNFRTYLLRRVTVVLNAGWAYQVNEDDACDDKYCEFVTGLNNFDSFCQNHLPYLFSKFHIKYSDLYI